MRARKRGYGSALLRQGACTRLWFWIFLCLSWSWPRAQSLEGELSGHAGKEVVLEGFTLDQSQVLARGIVNPQGVFSLRYPAAYRGMGVLKSDGAELRLLLEEKAIVIKGTRLDTPEGLEFLQSPLNQEFAQIAQKEGEYHRSYGAWYYLRDQYQKGSLEQQQAVRNQIAQEMARLDAARVASLNALPKGNYAHWVAPLLQLLYDMPLSVQQYRERMPAHQAHFRRLDFSHPNFSTSGLWRPLIEGHYLLLENSGRQLEDVFLEMNRSSILLLDQLQDQPQRFQSTAEFLFRLFERRSLFTSSAFLSRYLLEDKSRTALLTPKFQNRLQKYGLLAVGQPAPDIQLDSRYKLSDLKRNVLLVFGQSDCGSCAQQLPELQNYYPQWKEKLEVVYLSLDTDAEAFKSFYGNSPFKVYCEFQGWESPTAQQYFVNGTPTYLLLDSELKVLEHIVSLAQVDNWVKFKL